MWVCHGTGYFETLIFPIPAVSTVHQRVLTVCFSCSSIKQIPSKYFLCLCAFHHRKTWTCWAGILSGRIQCWLYKGKGDRSQADHPVSLTVVSSWSDAHISVLCQMCVLQDGRVVLGGPGSFYWQGEVMGTSHTWVFWRGYWVFFFRSEEDEKTSWWEGRTTQWSYFNVFVTMSKFTQTLSLNHDGETDTIYIKKTSNQHKQRLLISSWFRPRVSSRFQQCFNSSPLWDYQRLI